MEEIKLTQFSHGSGCGCKIAPKDLESILNSSFVFPDNDKLIVGNHTKDDAAVYDLGNDQYLISTTDFFTPITDNAFDFGKIAAANSISDIYAMGGTPILAIAILGWPVGKLPNELAQKVLEGGREICKKANIPLAGGHSIDSPEPFFGLAVNGITTKKRLKKNNTAKEGDILILTKPLGVGILSTAAKRGVVKKEDHQRALESMMQLNSIGEKLSFMEGVNAMTDVTGFGLLGHLIEICEGSNLSVEIEYAKIPLMENLSHYTSQFIYPDNTMRNWSSYQHKVEGISGESLLTLSDPQTNGGLLVSVSEKNILEIEKLLLEVKIEMNIIGKTTKRLEKIVILK
jgi:selenide,water dikinase